MLAHAPIHRNVAPTHGGAVVIHLLHQRMRAQGGGQRGDLFSQTLPLCHGNGGIARIGPLFAQKWGPVDRVLALEVGQHRVNRVFARVHRRAEGLEHVITKGLAQALSRQFVGVQLASARMGSNLLVHQRLGQRRCVLLVVAEFAETDDVKHHVLAEFHAELKRPLHRHDHRLGIVAVDVHHRCLNALDNVGAVQGGAVVARVRGGKTNLVVDDDVHRACRGVTAGLRQGQGFLVDTLTGKRGVAVHQHRQHLAACGVRAAVHAGAHRAFHHRVHDFQV